MDDNAVRTLVSRFKADVMFWILPMIFRPWSILAVMNVYRREHLSLSKAASTVGFWA